MRIENKTQFSIKLIKDIMRHAKVARQDAQLIITHDKADADKHGYYHGLLVEGVITHIINVAQSGDILTLGHELRHLAQVQRLGVNKFNSIDVNILEKDAELFEAYLLNKGY